MATPELFVYQQLIIIGVLISVFCRIQFYLLVRRGKAHAATQGHNLIPQSTRSYAIFTCLWALNQSASARDEKLAAIVAACGRYRGGIYAGLTVALIGAFLELYAFVHNMS